MARARTIAASAALLGAALGIAFLAARRPDRPSGSEDGATASQTRATPAPAKPLAPPIGLRGTRGAERSGSATSDGAPGRDGATDATEGVIVRDDEGKAHLETPLAARPLPLTANGEVDFAALGLTGKEPGAELLAAAAPARTADVRLDLREGERWLVESFYRQMQTGEGSTWSGPIRWEYLVEGDDVFRGTPCVVVRVRMVEADGSATEGFGDSRFYLSRDSRRLLGANVYARSAGKGKTSTVAYQPDGEPAAGAAEGAIAPFDLPPDGIDGALRAGRSLPSFDPGLSERDRARFPQTGELVGAGEALIHVEFRSPRDGTAVRQRWAPSDLRWPVESITETTRSYRRRID